MHLPVNIILSDTSLWDKFTTRLNKKARPVEPVNLVEMSSSLKKNHTKDQHICIYFLMQLSSYHHIYLFVRNVSHVPQKKRRDPPKCSK